jgi:hypothetical protein
MAGPARPPAHPQLAFLDAIGLSNANLVGYSDGAVVALLVALQRPDLVADQLWASPRPRHGRGPPLVHHRRRSAESAATTSGRRRGPEHSRRRSSQEEPATE